MSRLPSWSPALPTRDQVSPLICWSGRTIKCELVLKTEQRHDEWCQNLVRDGQAGRKEGTPIRATMDA